MWGVVTNALGMKDGDEKYSFIAAIYGAVFVNRIDDKVEVETLIKKTFERFDLLE